MSDIETLFIANDNLLRITGIKSGGNNLYLNFATVSVTLRDAHTDVEVAGETWPVTMAYIAGSDGDYQGTLVDTLVVEPFQKLRADVTVDSGPGLRGFLRVPVVGHHRTGD